MRKHAKNEGWCARRCSSWRSLPSASPAAPRRNSRANSPNSSTAPRPTPKSKRCLYSLTNGGEVMLGKKTVPIEKAVDPAGRLRHAEEPEAEFSKFYRGHQRHRRSPKPPRTSPAACSASCPTHHRRSWSKR